MKANELSSKDLMVGDWVMSKELKTPVKVCSIMNHYETTIYFCCQGNEFIVNSYQLEPIPLNKWRRNNFDWDLSRAAKKKKIEKIINEQTKQENGQ
jgi:hypothetical protein